MAIVLQDYDPWENIGRLVGQYAGYRMGLNQQNNMAKTYNDTFKAPQQPNVDTTPVSTGGLWANAMRNHTPVLNTERLQPTIQQGGLLTGNVQNVVPNQVDSSPVQQPQGGLPTGQPMQQGGLFTGQQAMNQVSPFSDLPSSYEEWLKKKETTVTGDQDDGTPNRAGIRKQTFQEMGQKILALVKGGFDFNTARQIANEWREQEEGDRYGQQVSQYQDTVLEPMRQQIMNNLVYTQDKDGNPVVDTYNTKRVKGLAPAVARYNYLASKVGAGTIDMNNLNSIAAIDKPDYKFSSAQNGHIVRYNMGDGTIQDMGGYGKVETKQFANGQVVVMTPDGQMKNIGNFGAKNIKVLPDGKTYIVGTDGSMKYVGMHVKPATATQTGTSGYNAQVLRTLSAQHTAWVKANPDKAETESPYYGQLQSALSGAPTGGGGAGTPTVKRQPTYSSEEQAAVSKRMNELSAQGWSDDQIAAELDAAGYGNYKSWLKSY